MPIRFLACFFLVCFIERLCAQVNQRPNILFVIIDDGRYADYASTGGPSWFITPTINRIADEGANFKKDYVVLSLCEPSRVSIFTGTYPHHNGFTNNAQTYDTSTLTISRILRDHGYYTGLVGRFINEYEAFPSADFNYYFAYSGMGNYDPKTFDLNGTDTLLDENAQEAINDYALHFLQLVPDTMPFFLLYTTKAPHPPYTAYPGYENAYDSQPVPFPENFHGYTKNYPNYIYFDNYYGSDSATCVSDIQTYYETLIGVEQGLDSVFSVLESKDILDSTLIIYTSDNGVFIGDHYLLRKRLAYEESMHVPLFVRYPKWFPAHTVVDDQFSLNIDFFKTILDAAAITDTFDDDGISLLDLANHTQDRDLFLFEYIYDTLQEGIPDFRAVRSMGYKYIRSSCEQATEEFYDVQNDPREDTNQIFNPSYAALIDEYRYKLDSLRTALGDDPSADTIITCSLLNVDTVFTATSAFENDFSFSLSPNPVGDILAIRIIHPPVATISFAVTDLEGRVMEEEQFSFSGYQKSVTINFQVHKLPIGLYTLRVKNTNFSRSGLFVKE